MKNVHNSSAQGHIEYNYSNNILPKFKSYFHSMIDVTIMDIIDCLYPSLNHHLTGGVPCLNDPGTKLSRAIAPGMVSHGKHVQEMGKTKCSSSTHHENKHNSKDIYVTKIDVTSAPLWSQAWGWGSQTNAWWPGLYLWDQNDDVDSPSSRLPTSKKVHEGPVQCGLGGSCGQRL